MRAVRAATIVVSLLGMLVLPFPSATSAQAADATQVALTITTSQPAAVGSTVTFRAAISPAAAGSVAFTIDERPLATVPVSGGFATTSVRVGTAGQYFVRAAFTPVSGSATATSATSGNVVLIVGTVARVSVLDAGGRPLAPGGMLPAGSPIRLAVAGFPTRTGVTFTIGAAALPGSLTTDSTGAGVLRTRVPGVTKGEYLVVAYGGRASAVATIVVDGIVPGATPTPTFCPATTPPPTDSASPTPTRTTPKPTSSSPRPTKTTRPPTEGGSPTGSRPPSSSPGAGDDDDDDGLPGTGGGLPGTGAAVLSLLVLAGLALAFGTGLISIGRRPSGRHSR